jgi:hypothetical protein
VDVNQNKTITMIENYLLDIEYIKEFAKKIMRVDNNYDSYNDFKIALEIIMGKLPSIEKYCKEHINKLKNSETHPNNIQEYLDNLSFAYEDFLRDYKNEKRNKKNSDALKSMIDFTNKLNSFENTYKMKAYETKCIEEEKTNEIRTQSQIGQVDFNQIKEDKKDSINVFKDFIKDLNSLIHGLNRKSKFSENEEIPKHLIKSLEKSINILNTFIKIRKEQSKAINEIKKSSKY